MARYLHTMVRVTDPERSRGFYEALGYELYGDGFVSELTGIPHRAARKRLG